MHEFKAEEGFAAKKAGDNAAYPAMGRQSRTTLESGNTPMYHMFHDAERCIMCYSCEVHCKLENNLPVGPRLIRMIQVGPKVVGGRLKSQFVYLSCHHCDPAACVSACPTGAMQKRADGIVFVDEKACIGCKTCITACPWGSPQYNPKTKKVVKCNYCMERVDRGLWPACAQMCATHCLYFGNINEYASVLRERYARRIAESVEMQVEAAAVGR